MTKRLRRKLGRGEFAPQGFARIFAATGKYAREFGSHFQSLGPILARMDESLDRIDAAMSDTGKD